MDQSYDNEEDDPYYSVKCGLPFGWVRRSDCDPPGDLLEVWELPDGRFRAVGKRIRNEPDTSG